MPSNTPEEELLAYLAASWPKGWPDLQDDVGHPLRYEIAALREGGEANLPFFHGTEVAWLTSARSAAGLRSAIIGLRAWVIPSFAWEDRARPIVAPAVYRGPLAALLAQVAPAGYYRWHSTAAAARGRIVEKLVLWRKLRKLRPVAADAVEPSLFELREQFQLALVTADRALAEAAVAAIDDKQLDTAANTSFMRTRMRARFGSHAEIVRDPNLVRILALRLPQAVRAAITEAFFEVYVHDLVAQGKIPEARAAIAGQVMPEIASLLTLARPEDGEGTGWLLAHLPPRAPSDTPPESDEQAFFGALRRFDWPRVQDTGWKLLHSGELAESLRPLVRSGLVESLKHEPNAALEVALQLPAQAPAVAQDWTQFLEAVGGSKKEAAEGYLALPERLPLDLANATATQEVIATVEEMLTSPPDASASLVLGRSLPYLVEDLVGDRSFPRCELASSYLVMLRLWVGERCGSTLPGDSNVVLSLASGVLQCMNREETEAADLLRAWWEGRPVKAKLPFLLSALDLLTEFCSQPSTGQGLWIDGVTFIRSRGIDLTRTEGALWQAMGRALGFERAIVEEYLPAETSPGGEEPPRDALAAAGFRKIAIVSLHEKSAKGAAEIISERSGAQVVIVDELVAGPATESARDAEVILLVWAATKHAVYRALDDVRDRLAYVQGTGTSSIVLALERWVMKSRTGETG